MCTPSRVWVCIMGMFTSQWYRVCALDTVDSGGMGMLLPNSKGMCNSEWYRVCAVGSGGVGEWSSIRKRQPSAWHPCQR